MAAAPPSEYQDDAARIDREYIPDNATDPADVERALKDAGFPEKAQSAIQSWLVDEGDAWEQVGPQTQDADSVRRTLERESDGTVSPGRAQQIGDNVASTINQARGEAAKRVDDTGQVRSDDGRYIGKIQNLDEQVRNDGIYYQNTNTGTEARVARFDR